MSFKPEVFVEGKWSQNGLVFATHDEAKAYAQDLYCRWTLCTNHRAVESSEPVNYKFVDGKLEYIAPITNEKATV